MHPLDRLLDRARCKERLVVGLMSGMSRDGIDVALVRMTARPDAFPAVELVAAQTRPYGDALRARLAQAVGGSLDAVGALAHELPELWADAVLALLREAAVQPDEVLAIASHGQTVWHRPGAGGQAAATLQVGHGAVLAKRTGVAVVSDFRVTDIAWGGEGAPLVPLADLMLYGSADEPVACWNLGSIANVTVIPQVRTPSARRGVLAFDTGPANALIDGFAARIAAGPGYDRDGELSARGAVREDVLLSLYERRAAWLRQAPPKSAGFDTWGPGLVAALLDAHPDLGLEDGVATAVEATAQMLFDAYAWHVAPGWPSLRRVHLSGGGCHNRTLMARVQDKFAATGLTLEALPTPWCDSKEAVAFALLGDAYLRGETGNVPAATGATRHVRLGSVWLPA